METQPKPILRFLVNQLFILVLVFPDSSLVQPTSGTIRTPRVTNWGDWGAMEMCQSGTVVTGFKLKTEESQGSGDDTALNGIELHCGAIGSNTVVSNIRSSIGEWGTWGRDFPCSDGNVMTGFELRSEPSLGTEVDDTAANNFASFCSIVKTHDITELIAGDGQNWGDWGTPQHCPRGSAICGISTQVEPPQGQDVTQGM